MEKMENKGNMKNTDPTLVGTPKDINSTGDFGDCDAKLWPY